MKHLLADVVAPLDALLLKGDGDPATRAIMTFALVLSGPPDIDRLTGSFERASSAVPRMRQRVVSPWSHGRARWVTDDAFDVGGHLRRIGAPGDASLDAVLSWRVTRRPPPSIPRGPFGMQRLSRG
jgi:hypothetical protein